MELEDSRSIGEMYPILHAAPTKIYQEFNAFIVFGFYAVNVNDERYIRISKILSEYKDSEAHIINYHGIVIDGKAMTIYCDITKSFNITPEIIIDKVSGYLKKEFPAYQIHVNIDTGFTGE